MYLPVNTKRWWMGLEEGFYHAALYSLGKQTFVKSMLIGRKVKGMDGVVMRRIWSHTSNIE